MKILFLTGAFYPQLGGVEKSVYSVSAELCRNGYSIDIVTQKTDKTSSEFEEFPEGFRVHRIPPSKIPKTGIFWKWIWFLFHIKLIWNADIIHFHDFDVLIKWFFPYRFLFFRKKYYITFHGYEGFPLRYKHIFYRKIAEKITHGNICVGEFIKRWYRTKPDIIYYAAVYPPAENISSVIGDDILFIGRLEKDTEIMNYLEALKLFYENSNSKSCFKIVGDGSLREKAAAFLKENNIPHKFYGMQKNPNEFIKNARVVLASSYLSMLEAMSYGKVVIAFYSNNIKRDYLTSFPDYDYSFIVMEDVARTAKKIESVYLHTEKYDSMRQSAIITAKELTWSKVAAKYISLYNKNRDNEN